MIPVLDNEIPCVNQRKHDQFCYIPNCDNSQLEYLLDERVHKHPSHEHSSTILDSHSCHGRNLLKSCQRPLTHRQNYKRRNDEVVTNNIRIYNDEWQRMKGTRRGIVTTTCNDGTNATKILYFTSQRMDKCHQDHNCHEGFCIIMHFQGKL